MTTLGETTPAREGPTVVAGRYEVFEPIASGGSATVHLGRLVGPHGFSRPVAIKRLHPQLARDRALVVELREEARIVSRIQHHNVVSILDVIETGDGIALVMDYVEGEPLGSLVSATRKTTGRPPPPSIVAAIMASVLRGLHAAHEATSNGDPLGIVHRDVSPQNIIVGGDGVARIVDFGIAKALGRLVETTTHGAIKGKLPYMAPEQFRAGAVLTRRTDVYGAGVVLWEALTATHLFDADDLRVASSARPAVRPPSEVEPSVPSALDAVVLRALSADPGARFATAEAMARAIDEAISVASVHDVIRWVHDVASEALERHARRLRSLDSREAVIQARTASASTASTELPARAWRRRWPTAALTVLAFGVTAAIVGRWASDPPVATPTTSTVAATSTSTPDTEITPAASAVPESASTVATPIASTSTSTSPSGAGRRTVPRASVKTIDCHKPYYVQNGVKIFRPECLR